MALVIIWTIKVGRGIARITASGAERAVALLARPLARTLRRALVLDLFAALLLSSCALGPGQAYLTIVNPNDPTAGTFNYTTIILDGVLQPYTVLAGASLQLPVLYNQSHVLSYVFDVKTGTTNTQTSEGPTTIFVPQGGYTFIGVKY